MTKKGFFPLILILCSMCLCACYACTKAPSKDKEESVKEFVADSFNARMVKAIADAYELFVETDAMPAEVIVQGVKYNTGKYLSAGIQILGMIANTPDTWKEDYVSSESFACPSNDKNNTVNIDEMPLEQYLSVCDIITEYAQKGGYYPNYCTVEKSFTDVDGSVYDQKITINSIVVMLGRAMSYYVKNLALPESLLTWDSDYLRRTTNCEVGDEAVVEAVNIATQGKDTQYQKAEAIFNYCRNEWEWENYANTRHSAVKVIERKVANCCDLSHGIIAMARTAGIPARYRHAQCQYSSSIIGHVVAELYVDGVWYVCDASNNNNTFGNHEAWKHMATFNGRYKTLPF